MLPRRGSRKAAAARTAPVAAALLILAIAGCSGSSADRPAVRLDTITPGVWDIAADTDQVLVWVHNERASWSNVTLALRNATGGPLPDGWSASFATPRMSLAPNGTKAGTARVTYPDWGWTLATVSVPADLRGRDVTLRLEATDGKVPGDARHAMDATRDVKVHVRDRRGMVTVEGSHVNGTYTGAYVGGQVFQGAPFAAQVGSGVAVEGFDQGLVGLRLNETVSLVVPPPLAYGYDQAAPATDRPDWRPHNGKWFVFDVHVTAIR